MKARDGVVGQDRTIVDVFDGKKGGFFVDLAANDAVRLSNTLTLEKMFGWKGLCIEPNPGYMKGYLHRKCQLVQAVVGPVEDETVSFKFDSGALGGIVGEGFDNKEAGNAPMYTVSVGKILQDFSAPSLIDYLSLDIEGANPYKHRHAPIALLTELCHSFCVHPHTHQVLSKSVEAAATLSAP